MHPFSTSPRRGFLILAISFVAWLQIASSAYGEVPGDGRPINLLSCYLEQDARDFAAALMEGKPSIPSTCTAHRRPYYPTIAQIRAAELVIGPARDFEGDWFGLFAEDSSGQTLYHFVWWAESRSPIGFRI